MMSLYPHARRSTRRCRAATFGPDAAGRCGSLGVSAFLRRAVAVGILLGLSTIGGSVRGDSVQAGVHGAPASSGPLGLLDAPLAFTSQHGGWCLCGFDLHGNYAYAGIGPRLMVFDLTDPAAPREVGSYAGLPGGAGEVVVAGERAYVTTSWRGFQIFDLGDPTAPRPIGGYEAQPSVRDLAVQGEIVYAAAGPDGLLVLDVSDPTAPELVGQLETPDDADVLAVAGDRAFLGIWGDDVWIVDMSDPSAPVKLAEHDVDGDVSDLQVAGDILYLSVLEEGLELVDVSDPGAPRSLGWHVTELWEAGPVAVAKNIAYLGASDELRVLDVSDPAAPDPLTILSLPDRISDIHVRDGLVYTSDYGGGLRVLDLQAPRPNWDLGSLDADAPFEHFEDVGLYGSVAYLASNVDGLHVVDLESTPMQLGFHLSVAEPLARLVLSGDQLFAAGRRKVYLVDLTDPLAPQVQATFEPEESQLSDLADFAVAGDWLYAVYTANAFDGSGGLQVVDIRDPADPLPAGSLPMPRTSESDRLVAGSGRVYWARDGGVDALDLGQPAEPRLLGRIEGRYYPQRLALSGDHLYLADEELGLQVLDFGVPAAPREVARRALDAADVAIVDDRAYVTNYERLVVFDLSQPASPQPLGSFRLPSQAGALAISGARAAVLTGRMGASPPQLGQSMRLVGLGGAIGQPPVGEIDRFGGWTQLLTFAKGQLLTITHNPRSAPRLRALELGASGATKVLGSATISARWVSSLVAEDDLACTASAFWSGGQIHCFTLTDAGPRERGSLATEDAEVEIALSGGVLAATDAEYDRLLLYDVATYEQPQWLAAVELDDSPRELHLAGGVLYVLIDGSLQTFDVHDASNPLPLGRLALDRPDIDLQDEFAAWSDGRLYITAAAEILVFDLHEPQSPRLLGRFDRPADGAGFSYLLGAAGSRLYLTRFMSTDDLIVLDAADPTAPTTVQIVPPPDFGRSVSFYSTAFAGDAVWLGTDHLGAVELRPAIDRVVARLYLPAVRKQAE